MKVYEITGVSVGTRFIASGPSYAFRPGGRDESRPYSLINVHKAAFFKGIR